MRAARATCVAICLTTPGPLGLRQGGGAAEMRAKAILLYCCAGWIGGPGALPWGPGPGR